MNDSNFEGTRSYLVGRKTILEDNKEKLIAAKAKFEGDCLELMSKLESMTNEGIEKYNAEISRIQVSIDLHQGMLVSLDEERKIDSVDEFTLESRRELSNLETVIKLTDEKIKYLFTQKEARNNIVKRTIVEEQKPIEPILVPTDKRQQRIANVESQLFKEPFVYKPYPEENYIRPNGYVNIKYVGDRLYEYMRDWKNQMTTKEMAEWISRMFPRSTDRWSSMDKGVGNVIQLHLKRNSLVFSIGSGIYRIKEA